MLLRQLPPLSLSLFEPCSHQAKPEHFKLSLEKPGLGFEPAILLSCSVPDSAWLRIPGLDGTSHRNAGPMPWLSSMGHREGQPLFRIIVLYLGCLLESPAEVLRPWVSATPRTNQIYISRGGTQAAVFRTPLCKQIKSHGFRIVLLRL